MALLSVGLTDELWSGVAVVAAPEVERVQAVEHAGYALAVFAVPLLLSSLLEASVAMLSHVVSRQRLVRYSLWVLGGALFSCAAATRPWQLALGLSVAGAASGICCGAAETALVARHPGALDRTMARWMVAGGVGDVLAPSLVAFCLVHGWGYRAAFIVVCGFIGVQAWGLRGVGDAVADGADEDEAAMSMWVALRESVRNRELWRWLGGTALCTLLDELVAALAALRLRTELGASDAQASAMLIGYSCGVIGGALLTERVVSKLGYRPILLVSAVLCGVALSTTIAATSLFGVGAGLTLLGFTAAAHYPLLLARAYEAAPGCAAMVGAMAEVFVVIDLALPWLLVCWPTPMACSSRFGAFSLNLLVFWCWP